MRGSASCLCLWAVASIALTTGCRQPAAPRTPPPPSNIINPFLGTTTLPPPPMTPAGNGAAGGLPATSGAATRLPVDDANLPGPGENSGARATDDGGWKGASMSPVGSGYSDPHRSIPTLRSGSTIQQAVYEEELPVAAERSTGLVDSAGDRYLRSTKSGDDDLPPSGSKDVRLATYQEAAPAGQSIGKARSSTGWGPALKKGAATSAPGASGTAAANGTSATSANGSTSTPGPYSTSTYSASTGEPATFSPPPDAEPLPASASAAPLRVRIP